MSRRNRIGKEIARQRAAIEQAEAEYRAKRNRRLAIYGPILGVIVVAGVVTLVLGTHAFSSAGTPAAKASATTVSTSASATVSASASAKASSAPSASATASPSASKS